MADSCGDKQQPTRSDEYRAGYLDGVAGKPPRQPLLTPKWGDPWALERELGKEYSIPSSTAFVPEGERKSLAGQAIEMAISALRDIQRRAPGTRTFFDYEAFIERELVPAMAMADKDRQGCIGLMGLLAKEKLKVEELSKPVSATASIRVPRDQLIEWALWLKGRREVAGQVSMDSIETAILDLLNAPNDIGQSLG